MVQNQMTSAYPYAAQTGIDEYGHPQQVVVTSQPVSVAASAEQAVTFKADSATYPTTTVAANGGVEQQTVRPRSHSVRFNSYFLGMSWNEFAWPPVYSRIYMCNLCIWILCGFFLKFINRNSMGCVRFQAFTLLKIVF